MGVALRVAFQHEWNPEVDHSSRGRHEEDGPMCRYRPGAGEAQRCALDTGTERAILETDNGCTSSTILKADGMANFDDYVTVQEASERLKIHPESVRRLIRQGKLPARKFANSWLIEKSVLETFARWYDPRPGNKGTPH